MREVAFLRSKKSEGEEVPTFAYIPCNNIQYLKTKYCILSDFMILCIIKIGNSILRKNGNLIEKSNQQEENGDET